MDTHASAMKIYGELARYYHQLTPPEEYASEAAAYREAIDRAAERPVKTLLDLGSGGGCNAWHLKKRYECTLADLSPAMLGESQKINPGLVHVQGDMRTLRLGRAFDSVLVHDAIVYMLTREDLKKAIDTAYTHLAPGGVAVFAPDCLRETFVESTEHGGTGAVRYLGWVTDPDPSDETYIVDYVLLVHEGGEAKTFHDRHVEAVYPRATWLSLLEEAGFRVTIASRPDDDDGAFSSEIFVSVRPS